MKRTSQLLPWLFVALIGLCSCATTRINLDILAPADINVPGNIKKLVIVNRSLPGKDQKVKNIIEGFITGEGIFVDREASDACLKGVSNQLASSPRFSIYLVQDLNLAGTGTRQFPAPLEWEIIRDICEKNSSDALLSLEVFDSNNRLSFNNVQRSRKENDKTINYSVTVAHLRSEIEAGWRIYDPYNQRIIDQNIFNDFREWTAEGDNQRVAQAKLPRQADAVVNAGYFAGQQYARRISPSWVRQSRELFKKGNDEMKYAARLAMANQWNEAADVWQNIINSQNPKLAGAACFNLALASEINGDLKKAIEWTEKAFTRYNIKKALKYSYILKNRMATQQILDQQMNN